MEPLLGRFSPQKAPLDYGFVAIGGKGFSNATATNSDGPGLNSLSIVGFVAWSHDLSAPAPPVNGTQGIFSVSELATSQLSQTRPKNILAPFNGSSTAKSKVTYFSQSHIGPETVDYIFRCQALDAIVSSVRTVVYISPPTTLAEVDITPGEMYSFGLNIEAARVADDVYARYLHLGDIHI
ncbi:hypothetical protein GALMADRAFT_216552 [Galerina marginata CBS 339.88]|uniref:Uncharacterized protein n=1 Tax=Galerina marginata (strain CBS 339.88) TaxID=685588 RepID=A0A067S8Q8_GALM3|nr:hypothetical protein GALMADRAFT_216552 [Galerina marginata CBS 339.88]